MMTLPQVEWKDQKDHSKEGLNWVKYELYQEKKKWGSWN
jgi:hypothetical protein